jgi:mitochondrial fission protein ELM1
MIETGMATREIIRRLKNNQLIGMVADQSGKEGMLIPFLSRNASFPTGAMRFALKLKATIIPAFTIRQKGPYHKIILEEPLQLEPTDSEESNIYDSVTKIKTLAEKYVRLYPEQYFWFYKVWKYSDQRSVIVLSDGRVGHLRQLEAILKILQDSKYKIKAEVVEINFKSKFAKLVLNLFAMFSKSAPYSGNFRYLKWFLKKDSYQRLVSLYADMVVSCGSSLSSVNRLLASQNNARSVVIMKPGLLSLKRFGLVIIPKHDNPPLQDNVVVTKGALNLIDAEYLKNHSEKLQSKIMLKDNKIKIGLLLGGDNRGFVLKREPIKEIIGQIKSITAQLDAELLITTSRRTSSEIEELVKSEFKDYAPCKLLVIANETNIPEAVGGILGLSQIVILSADSISMISEAASSGKYVVVFDTQDCCAQLSKRHARFLKELSHEGYINFVDYRRISDTLKDIHKKKPAIKILNDKEVVKESLLRLL